ncbi:MAG: hypothetical protein ACTSQP_22070 [Promethearchaeota archaeon]
MPNLRNWVKLFLFISAYTPLFIILIVKYIELMSICFWIFIILLFFANMILYLILKKAKKWTRIRITVQKSENRTADSLNYVIAYIIPFIDFNFNKWQDIFSITILMSIIFIIYINSNLIFVNPILQLIGYKIHNIEDINNRKYIIISKKSKFLKDEEIYIKNITNDIYLS